MALMGIRIFDIQSFKTDDAGEHEVALDLFARRPLPGRNAFFKNGTAGRAIADFF